jgi:hypothetical protein
VFLNKKRGDLTVTKRISSPFLIFSTVFPSFDASYNEGLENKAFTFMNASKRKTISVRTSLRKHGAETQLNNERYPTPD